MSVLFMSFVDRVEVIGFNRQWCAASGPAGHFLFGGIASHAELPAAVRSQLTDAVNKLSAAYQLRGLNTLDFMVAATGGYVLEINPRISASAQLYGRELLLRHLAAFGGTEVSGTKVSGEPLAYQIVYAAKTWKSMRTWIGRIGSWIGRSRARLLAWASRYAVLLPAEKFTAGRRAVAATAGHRSNPFEIRLLNSCNIRRASTNFHSPWCRSCWITLTN